MARITTQVANQNRAAEVEPGESVAGLGSDKIQEPRRPETFVKFLKYKDIRKRELNDGYPCGQRGGT